MFFRRDRLVAFLVSQEAIQLGYAEIGDCRPLREKLGRKVNECNADLTPIAQQYLVSGLPTIHSAQSHSPPRLRRW